MELVELNPIGNFNNWENKKLEELKNKNINTPYGKTILYYNDSIRLSKIVLHPYERMPFHKVYSRCYWISMSESLLISRYANGKINLFRIKKGESKLLVLDEAERVHDIENIGENLLIIHMIEYISFQENNKQKFQENIK